MGDIGIYLSGEKLYGDDFSLEEIETWYADEEEGYAELGSKNKSSYRYVYHALNERHGFRHLGTRTFPHVLGVGSAYGDEFLPIIHRIGELTIVDPSDVFTSDEVQGVPCTYAKPVIDGVLPFDDEAFDLISCLGVLHHIANVTTVVKELHRCLAKGGVLLVREPIISMGDWSKPRVGLTKRERGIPLHIFQDIIDAAGFTINHQSLCVFPLIPKLCNRVGIAAYNSFFATSIDAIICQMLKWNIRYHATNLLQKFRPVSAYFVLSK